MPHDVGAFVMVIGSGQWYAFERKAGAGELEQRGRAPRASCIGNANVRPLLQRSDIVPGARDFLERTPCCDVVRQALQVVRFDGAGNGWRHLDGVVARHIGENAVVRDVLVHAPLLADAHIAQHTADGVGKHLGVTVERIEQGAVDVEDDGLHRSWGPYFSAS